MTDIGDVVLVYIDNSPAFFARVEQIDPDIKAGWFQVKLLVLQLPLLTITWILREPYFNGGEFTMGGRPMRIEAVVAPSGEEEEQGPPREEEQPGKDKEEQPRPSLVKPKKDSKVVSIFDRKKKDHDPT